VTLTMPKRASEARARAFAEEKAGWIRQRLAERPDEVHVDLGTSLPVLGQTLTVARGDRSGILMDDSRIEVSRRSRSVPATVQGLLRAAAKVELAAASDRFAQSLGRAYTGITVRDTRSRWGSCSADGALMYSWRLILAPPEVLAYVCAHEVAHLAEMNHSARYWAVVERLWPGYRDHRAWLRQNGEKLHRYRFDSAGGD
jgi:predicted metal-dependent hydrolase